ncbi:MAG: hypothetical protein RLZZ338_516 [Cyanobacteriota bacterium]|jgi:sterol desaturase/sphingolipid hydroxylase (fatty acid hydroxylase superfamily)/rhodanese-related sulfurtransferase
MMSLEIIKGFILLSIIFITLERLLALHPQKIFRAGLKTDITYFLTGHIIGKNASKIIVFVTLLYLGNHVNLFWQNAVISQPIICQFIEAVIIADTGYYFAHRLLHTVPWLWQFHAVHHSIETMDWLGTVRVHPFDQIFTKIFQLTPLIVLGFNNETLAIYTLYSAAIAFFIHANIRLKLGRLKWVIASPEFHHWHHSQIPRTYHKNLAAQIPLLDLLFGTLYMPTGKKPEKYGIIDPVPPDYFRQFLYPFTRLNLMKNTSPSSQNSKGFSCYGSVYMIALAYLMVFGVVTSVIISELFYHVDLPTYITSFNTKQVTVNDLQEGKIKPVIFIDVRSREEYAEDRIGKSSLVPFVDFQGSLGVQEVKRIIKSNMKQNQPTPTIVLYCQKGPRSIKAYQKLKNTGFKFVVLSGGITAWRKVIPLEKDDQILTPILY